MPKQIKISNFIEKLASMIEEHPQAIDWSKSGKFFRVNNEEVLQRIVFPQYFRHANMSSFIRQLSAYKFKKVKINQEEGYYHPLFCFGNAANFHKIHKRRVQETQKIPLLGIKPQSGSKDTSVQNLMRKLVTFEYFCHRKTQNIKSLITNLKDQIVSQNKNKIHTMDKFKAIQQSIKCVQDFSKRVHHQFDEFIKNVDQVSHKNTNNPEDQQFFRGQSDSFALPQLFAKPSQSSPPIQYKNRITCD